MRNEVNLANNSMVSDKYVRNEELERFFCNAKPGDHAVIHINDDRRNDVTVIRLRNEIQ